MGGTLGAIITGLLATNKVNGNLLVATPANFATTNGCAKLVAEGGLVFEQLKAVGLTIVLAVVATAVIALVVKAVVGLRPTDENEEVGLDLSDHGEEGSTSLRRMLQWLSQGCAGAGNRPGAFASGT